MKYINVGVDNETYKQFGLKSDPTNLDEWLNFLRRKLALQALENCHRISKKLGLNKMTMKDINKEIKAHRDAKNRNRH